jgi:hypothetical protein
MAFHHHQTSPFPGINETIPAGPALRHFISKLAFTQLESIGAVNPAIIKTLFHTLTAESFATILLGRSGH